MGLRWVWETRGDISLYSLIIIAVIAFPESSVMSQVVTATVQFNWLESDQPGPGHPFF